MQGLESLLEEIRNSEVDLKDESLEDEEKRIMQLIKEARDRKIGMFEVATLSKEMRAKLESLHCKVFVKTCLPYVSVPNVVNVYGYVVSFV